MQKPDYKLQDHLKPLQSLYPQEPDVLHGDHKEAAILITKMNANGQFITLKSNNNQKNEGLESDKQVFLYDEDAIKTLIDHLSTTILSEYGLLIDSETLAKTWKNVLDDHTTLTVTQFLKPAVALVQQGELYNMSRENELAALRKIA